MKEQKKMNKQGISINKLQQQLTRYESGRHVVRWHLGLEAAPIDTTLIEKDDGSLSRTVFGERSPMTDGQYATWCAAGYAALLHGRGHYEQHTWSQVKFQAAIEEHTDNKEHCSYEFHDQDDFDQIIYTGVELTGKADYQDIVSNNIENILPLSEDDRKVLEWTCFSYMWIAQTIIDRNWDKVKQLTNLLREKGGLCMSEVEALYKEWGKPLDLDLSFKRIEKVIGICPCKNINRDTFDLVKYVAFSHEGYGYSGKDKFAA